MRDTPKPRVYKRGPYWVAHIPWFVGGASYSSYSHARWQDAIATALNGGPLESPLLSEVPC